MQKAISMYTKFLFSHSITYSNHKSIHIQNITNIRPKRFQLGAWLIAKGSEAYPNMITYFKDFLSGSQVIVILGAELRLSLIFSSRREGELETSVMLECI